VLGDKRGAIELAGVVLLVERGRGDQRGAGSAAAELTGVVLLVERVFGNQRGAIVGRGLFEVFPDDPSDPEVTGTRSLAASIARAISSYLE
jgi:hypothetical protein